MEDKIQKLLGTVVNLHAKFGEHTYAGKGRLHGNLISGKYEFYEGGELKMTFELRHVIVVGDHWLTVVVP